MRSSGALACYAGQVATDFLRVCFIPAFFVVPVLPAGFLAAAFTLVLVVAFVLLDAGAAVLFLPVPLVVDVPILAYKYVGHSGVTSK